MWKSIPFSIWRKILFRKKLVFSYIFKIKKKKMKTKILLFKYLYQNEKYSSSKSVYQNQCFFRECMCKKSREFFLVASKCFKNNDFTFQNQNSKWKTCWTKEKNETVKSDWRLPRHTCSEWSQRAELSESPKTFIFSSHTNRE